MLVIGIIQFILNITPAWNIQLQQEGMVFTFREPYSVYMKRLSMQGGSANAWKPDVDQLSGVAYLKIEPLEGMRLPQQVFLFILNQEPDGLKVLNKLEIPTSEILPAEKGVQFYYFPEPVKLLPGYSYAHWQQAYFRSSWLPISLKIGSIDGLSFQGILPDPEAIEYSTIIEKALPSWRRTFYLAISVVGENE